MVKPRKTEKKPAKITPVKRAEDSPDVPKSAADWRKLVSWKKVPSRGRWVEILFILIVVGVAYFFLTGGFNRNTVVIGDTRITKSDITNFADQITTYTKAHPATALSENVNQFASDRLILNAALKLEAQKYHVTISDNDLAAAGDQTFSNAQEETDYFDNLRAQKNNFELIGWENQIYESKLQTKLIKTENLTMVTMILDTPYFDSLSGSKAQAAYSQAKARMTNEFLPLVAKGEPESQIATKGDIAYANAQEPSQTNAEIGQALGMYYSQGVVAVSELNGYQEGITGFNDNNSTSWETANPGTLNSTAGVINKLKKVGDNSGVVATKTGAYMIFRLDSIHGGTYNSWADFLNSYKEKYARGKLPITLTGITNSVVGLANTLIATITTPGLAQAFADSSNQLCTDGQHDFNITFVAWNITANLPISGVTMSYTRYSTEPSYPFNGANITDSICGQNPRQATSDGNTNPDSTNTTVNDSCYNVPPVFSIGPDPSGFVKATPSWNQGYSQGWIYSGLNAYGTENPYINKDNLQSINPGWPDYFPQWNNYNATQTQNIAPGISNINDYSVVELYKSTQPVPEGKITQADCGGVTVSAYMSDGSAVNFTVKRENSTTGISPVISPTATRDVNGDQTPYYYQADNPNNFPDGGLSNAYNTYNPIPFILYVNGVQIGTTFPEYNSDGSNCPSPNGDVTATCTTAVLDSDTATERIQMVSISGAYYASGSPGNGQEVYYDQSPMYFHYYPSGTGAVTVTTQVWQRSSPTASDWSLKGPQTNTVVNNCYAATCSVSFPPGENPWGPGGGPANSVPYNPSNPGFQISVTINNTGAAVLPASTGDGNQLGVETTFSSGAAAAYNYIGASIQPGSPASFSFGVNPPSSGIISFTAGYYGNGGWNLASCGSFDIYQHFDVSANTSMSTTNSEDPTTIYYSTWGQLLDGPTINAQATSCLTTDESDPSCSASPVVLKSNAPGGLARTYGTPAHDSDDPTVQSPPQLPSYSPPSIVLGSQYCANEEINPGTGWVDTNNANNTYGTSPVDAPPSGCITVSNVPYVHFFGSDVDAGGGFATTSTSSCGAAGNIYTESDTPAGGQLKAGSGSQFAAMSIGQIEGFSSAFLRTLNPPYAPTGLTFANSYFPTSPPAIGLPTVYMGGSFNENFCVPDYYTNDKYSGIAATGSATTSMTPGVTIPSGSGEQVSKTNASGAKDIQQFYQPPAGTPLTINGTTTFPSSTNETIFVDGNVYISGNISYADANNGNWTSVNDIPSLYIITSGNIYIAPGVTELDGVYVAEPNGANTGYIDTCGSSTGPIGTLNLFTYQGGTNTCGQQLTINGAFVAQDIYLNRTFSSLRFGSPSENPQGPASTLGCGTPGSDIAAGDTAQQFASDCAAEIFNFSPELYLSQPALQSTSTGKFNFITSLSPVL